MILKTAQFKNQTRSPYIGHIVHMKKKYKFQLTSATLKANQLKYISNCYFHLNRSVQFKLIFANFILKLAYGFLRRGHK